MLNNKHRWSIALILLLTVSMLALAIPKIKSAVMDRQITLLIAAAPETVGVGEAVQILCWSDIYPNTYVPSNSSVGPGSLVYPRFHDFTFTITHPDGTTETKTFPETDPLGANYFNYVPAKIGTYTVVCNYPGESFVGDVSFNAEVNFLPATSKTVSFDAQEEPIPRWSENPLPTEYWARPIDAGNQLWTTISGNWLSMSQGAGKDYWTNFQPYSEAPNSAHILWANVFQDGGLVGGELLTDYYSGESYQGKFRPIILNGRLFTNLKVGSATTRGFICYDLRTGTELYRRNDTTVNMGFTYALQWENQHGSIDYIITVGGGWGMPGYLDFLDPMNGERCFTISGVSSGAYIVNNSAGAGFTNDLESYVLSGNRLILWSFDKLMGPKSGFTFSPSPTATYNWANGIVYNVSIPAPPNSGSYSIGSMSGGLVDGDILIATSTNKTSAEPPISWIIGIRCSDGQILWEVETQDINDPSIWRHGGGTHLSSDGGVFLQYKKETMEVIAYDLDDGSIKYITDPRNASDWGMYTSGWPMDTAYGKFYVGAYDGYIMAYDLETGDLLWQYYAGDAGFETPYGTYPFFLGIPYGMYIADGKIFAMTGEHSPNDPLYRGERLHVIDAETGDPVWSIQGWWVAMGIADGEIVGYNCYDGRVYAFGKGPSATTVSIQNDVTTYGNKVVIKGTVTDISAGTEDFTISARFPDGVPAMSDESQSEWMEYLYMQQPLPSDATGVEVLIDVLDSNGNYRNIGTTTSDATGFYSFTWDPDIPGDFKVIATFAGSESYYASCSETAFTVVEPEVTPAPTASPAPMTDTYVLGIGAAAIIAIVLIGLIIILMLRKR